ncbi:MAG: amidohydrolase family protein [Nannocystaceae bacterium]|nr:amidohydrolase family protein [bacterium]
MRLASLFLMVFVWLSAGSSAAAELSFDDRSEGPRVAIVGATVHDGTGAVLEDAVVELQGARIVRVGTGAPSAGAKIIDAKGKIVTPGLIAASTTLGLVEIGMEGSTRDTSRNGEDPIRAGYDASMAVNANSTLLAVQAIDGVTTAATTPQGGLLSGQVAWIDLLPGHHRDIVARPRVAVAGGLGQRVAGSRAAAFAQLVEVLDDARFYRSRKSAFDRRASRDLAAHRLDLDALGPVLGRTIPLVLEAHRASDILAAIELAKAQSLRVTIVGATQGWQVADALAEAKIPVIVHPSTNLPGSFDRVGARLDNAAKLHAAGVTVGIAVLGEAHNVRNVTQEAGIAIANGLPREVALRGVTHTIASAYGMEADYGSLAPGKVANVVIWPADPFELSTVPEAVYIRGTSIALRSRQTELRDRYIERLGVR